MDSSGGSGMAGAGEKSGGGDSKEPAMVPFLSACFTELRAKGTCVCAATRKAENVKGEEHLLTEIRG